MTDEELRDKVAGLCGWTHLRVACGHLWGTAPDSDYSDLPEHWYAGCPGDTTKVPDYPRDLNAMHEAEKILEVRDGLLCIDYVNALKIVEEGVTKSRYGLVHATARQRAEAFVKTMTAQLREVQAQLRGDG